MPSPPTPSRLPAIVQTVWWMMDPVARLEEASRRHGDLYLVNNLVFGREAIISHPALVKEVLTGDPEVYQAGPVNAPLAPLAGETSVLILEGARHLRLRRLMLPPFHGERMQLYGQTMIDITDRVLDTWPAGGSFPLHPHMQHITLEVILRTVFGLDEGARMSALHDALAVLLDRVMSPMGMLFMSPALQRDLGPFTPWGGIVRARARADSLIYAQITRAKAAARTGRSDILTMLIDALDEDGRPLTDQELHDQLVTLLAAGHETTATALCWIFEQLLSHPEALDRALAELDEATGGGPLTPAHLGRLDYLDAVIKEALRLRPVIPFVGRLVKRATRLGGHDLPAGIIAAPCAYLAQRHPDCWKDPSRFLPDRFLGHKPDPYAWFPFGGGARRCLGMAFALYEAKAVTAAILRRATLRLAKPAPLKVVLRAFAFAPEGGTRVVLDRRRTL